MSYHPIDIHSAAVDLEHLAHNPPPQAPDIMFQVDDNGVIQDIFQLAVSVTHPDYDGKSTQCLWTTQGKTDQFDAIVLEKDQADFKKLFTAGQSKEKSSSLHLLIHSAGEIPQKVVTTLYQITVSRSADTPPSYLLQGTQLQD